jgi:hypothetical protein
MGDIINLKLQRKRKDRAARDEKAAENRAAFGRAKSERAVTGATAEKAAKDLDGHRRDE